MMSSEPSSYSSSDKACYFVTGCSADVGCGLVATLLEKGHCVATVTRQADTAKELRQRHANVGDHFLVVEGDLSTEEGTRKVWKEVFGKFPEIKHVVASVGGWEEMLKRNKIVENDISDLQTAFETFVVPQFNLAKVILPEIGEKKDCSYTIITGAAPCCFMGTGWGPVAVGIGAVHGLSTTLRGECKDCQVRVNEVRLGLRVLQERQVSDSSKISTYDLGKALAAITCCNDLKGEVVTFDTRDEVQECLKGDKSMLERAKEKMGDTKQQGQQLLERAKEKMSDTKQQGQQFLERAKEKMSSSSQGSEYQQGQSYQGQQPYQGQSYQGQPHQQEQGHEKGLLERAKEKLLGTSEQHSSSQQYQQQQPYSQQGSTESEKLQERMRTQQQQPSSNFQPSSSVIGTSQQPSSSSTFQPSSGISSHQPSSGISSGISSQQPSSGISSGISSSSQQPGFGSSGFGSSGFGSSSRTAPYTETEKIERVRVHPGGAPQHERESEIQERNRMLSEGGGQHSQEQQERERERGTGSEREKSEREKSEREKTKEKEKEKERNRERSSAAASNRPLA